MTYRLVGLMSVVLLLSLAAFALLISHYQGLVMDELGQTASAIGRATLETLESRGGSATVGLPANEFFYETALDEHVADLIREDAGEETAPAGLREIVMFSTTRPAPDHGEGFVMIRRPGEEPRRIPIDELTEDDIRDLGGIHVQDDPAASGEITVDIEQYRTAKEASPNDDGGPLLITEAETKGPAVVHEDRRVVTVVRLDGIRAEEEPGKGLFLTIPAFRAEDAGAFATAWKRGDDDTGAAAPSFTFQRDFRFEVPTDDYRDLFTRLRSRSGMVFLGVFLVGTALSAGLASRFTRPVRRLDAAIHRLSEGDLDVRVDVRGRDELARLGNAFNDMAQKLRVSRERSRELTRREKLSALGRLAAGVAHDVRNPLHSIGLTLQHLQEACAPGSPETRADFDRSVSIIRSEIQRLDKLVGNFLLFARNDRRERVPVRLDELARETVQLVGNEAERRGVEVRVETDGEIPRIPADAESIRASILNLVLNSFEAMPDGGNVTIRVGRGDGEVVLQVADDGHGIPDGDREKVFDFGYTTRESGHGLGLAMVHQVVVEEHGGRVSLETTPTDGTCVKMVFHDGGGEAVS